MSALETYLCEVDGIRSSGAAVPETSYYPAISNLLNEVGDGVRPKVTCVINPKNQGGGIPDGGLYLDSQLKNNPQGKSLKGPPPARGVMEVKGAKPDVGSIVGSQQVANYLKTYGQVLVTNLREFVLVGLDDAGAPLKLESHALAASEADFWTAAKAYRKTASSDAGLFEEFLTRVMLRGAPLSEPREVAWFLASYAKDARGRVESQGGVPALSQLRSSLEGALGIAFEADEGERFFRSTFVQTLFYGVFSAWVLWSQETPVGSTEKFRWNTAASYLHVPIIGALFLQIAAPYRLRTLGLIDVLDRTEDVLNSVDRAAFFKKFDLSGAVQYFYEPFLESFDPELRKRYGVWYTPHEVVRYMVERVDTVLREELGVEDGLASEEVYVLDPCTGTGSYVLEVLDRIHRTLQDQGKGALASHYVKEAAKNRVFGFELMPAPFVVAHLQIGLALTRMNAGLASGERAGVYLTNALTGWEPPEGAKARLPFPEFEDERDAAEEVKRDKPILVILGNPPYDAFAGVSPTEEEGLVQAYKEGLSSEWGVGKFNLDDLYVRFFRLAERRIVGGEPGRGVLCYISNFSYLRGASFTVMRKRLLESFDEVWVDSLNGDARETGKRTPWGTSDLSVFSTPQSSGIRVGTAVNLMVRKGKGEVAQAPEGISPDGGSAGTPRSGSMARTRFRELWGTNKREELLDSIAGADFDGRYEVLNPDGDSRFSMRPFDASRDYLSWPKLTDLCEVAPANGLMEKRRGALIDIDRDDLQDRMSSYYDKSVDWQSLQALESGLTKNAARFDAKKTRGKVLNVEAYDPDRLRRYAIRPFDTQWCYYSGVRSLWNEPRPTLWAQQWKGNSFLMSRVTASKNPEGPPFYFVRTLADDHLLSPDASCFPLRLRDDFMGDSHSDDAPTRANLSLDSRDYLSFLDFPDPDRDEGAAGMLWLHALAVGYSPRYLRENEDGVRGDWPRIPMPGDVDALAASSALGGEVAALLDTDKPVSGVTSGRIRPELKAMGGIQKKGGSALDTGGDDLAVVAGWGSRDSRGAVMPGGGKSEERDYTAEELEAVRHGAEALAMSEDDALSLLGRTTHDVSLNDDVYWENVPSRVWDYTIGGYQVIKKWLSYRERRVSGRRLTVAEVEEVTRMVRRIAALLLLEVRLDRNYEAVSRAFYPWPRQGEQGDPISSTVVAEEAQ